jgi:hypothetical protein
MEKQLVGKMKLSLDEIATKDVGDVMLTRYAC